MLDSESYLGPKLMFYNTKISGLVWLTYLNLDRGARKKKILASILNYTFSSQLQLTNIF